MSVHGTSVMKRGMERRAQSSTSFHIQDSSPLFTYSKDGWTNGYAAQPNGYDQTLHMSSQSGSRISFNIAATSLSLQVPAFDNCTSIISINSSNPIPACSTKATGSDNDIPFSLYSLPLGTHSVIWDVGNVPADTNVVFWGIDGTRPVDPSGYKNVTIDDTYTRSSDGEVELGYSGTWQSVREGVTTDFGEKESLDSYFNKTLAITKERGASVSFTGTGSAVYLYGNVGPDYGSATVSLNDQVAESSLNLTSPWPMPYELLWYRTGLDPSKPTEVIMTSLADSKMSLDFVLFTSDPETVSQMATPVAVDKDSFAETLAGKVVLFFLIPAVVITLLAFTLFMLFRRRRKQQALERELHHRRQMSTASDADFKFPNGTNSESHWSHEPKSSRYSSHSEPSEADLVFVSYDEGKGQRMSEHWNKASMSSGPSAPTATATSETAWNHEDYEHEILTPRSGRSRLSRSPPMELQSLPQSVRGSVPLGITTVHEDTAGMSGSEQYHGEDEQSETNSTWRQPFQSILSSRYPVSALTVSRRGTLPAYSADDESIPGIPTPPHSAVGTENASMINPADLEKRALHAAYSGYNTPNSPNANSPVSPDAAPGPSAPKRMTHQTQASAALSALSIESVFGAPPSEARRSVAPTPAPRGSMPRPPSRITTASTKRKPPPPDMPFISTSTSPTSSRLPFPSSPDSTRVHPKSSLPAAPDSVKPSLPPPTSFQDVMDANEAEGSGGHRRNRSMGGISARTDVSAARPDSVIIPFEDFVASTDSLRLPASIHDDFFGPGKGVDKKSSPLNDHSR